MNWASDTFTIYRVRNTSDQDVTGTMDVRAGGPRQERTVTVPANGEVFVGFTGTRGTFHQVTFDGPGGWDLTRNTNGALATGHVDITVSASTTPERIPSGYAVVAESAIETITWTWDGSAFVESGDLSGFRGDHVFEANPTPGVGRLDVPMDQTYRILPGTSPDVTVVIDQEPGTIPAFDPSRQDDPVYVNEAGSFWWSQGGKYQVNGVTVAGVPLPTEPTPEPTPTPDPTPSPEPTPTPTPTPEVPGGGGIVGDLEADDTEPSPAPEAEEQPAEELADTGASLGAGLAGAGLLAAGAGLLVAARRRTTTG
jgi:hypothetical protein